MRCRTMSYLKYEPVTKTSIRWPMLLNLAALGFLVFGGLGGGIGLFAGMEAASAAGLGAFVGIWGGPGFGAMLGGILAVTRDERALAKAG